MKMLDKLTNINMSNTQQRRTRNTLARQPDLGDFFSMDRSSSDHNQVRRSDVLQLENALRNFDEDNPIVRSLLEQLSAEQPSKMSGVDQYFLDSLDRVPKKKLKHSDSCPICSTDFLEDQYPLVVQLPCDSRHIFDLECIGPWLKVHATCPICRKDVLAKKEIDVPQDDEKEEEGWDMYG